MIPKLFLCKMFNRLMSAHNFPYLNFSSEFPTTISVTTKKHLQQNSSITLKMNNWHFSCRTGQNDWKQLYFRTVLPVNLNPQIMHIGSRCCATGPNIMLMLPHWPHSPSNHPSTVHGRRVIKEGFRIMTGKHGGTFVIRSEEHRNTKNELHLLWRHIIVTGLDSSFISGISGHKAIVGERSAGHIEWQWMGIGMNRFFVSLSFCVETRNVCEIPKQIFLFCSSFSVTRRPPPSSAPISNRPFSARRPLNC